MQINLTGTLVHRDHTSVASIGLSVLSMLCSVTVILYFFKPLAIDCNPVNKWKLCFNLLVANANFNILQTVFGPCNHNPRLYIFLPCKFCLQMIIFKRVTIDFWWSGVGVQTTPKKHDIINEQPLREINFLHLNFHISVFVKCGHFSALFFSNHHI